jgi:hypothetical protein
LTTLTTAELLTVMLFAPAPELPVTVIVPDPVVLTSSAMRAF